MKIGFFLVTEKVAHANKTVIILNQVPIPTVTRAYDLCNALIVVHKIMKESNPASK